MSRVMYMKAEGAGVLWYTLACWLFSSIVGARENEATSVSGPKEPPLYPLSYSDAG